MPSPVQMTRSAHGRRHARHGTARRELLGGSGRIGLGRQAPRWLGRSALVLTAALAAASGTAAAALVDAVTRPGGEVTASTTDAVQTYDAPFGAGAPSGTRVPMGDGPGGGGAPSSVSATMIIPDAGPVEAAEPSAPVEPIEPVLPEGMTPEDVAAGLLSMAVPASAEGTLVVVPGSEAAPAPERRVRTVRVEVEAGLDVDGALFARMVMDTLNDPRSWGAQGEVSFARTDGEAELRVVLASPAKVDEMCAPLTTRGIYSCGAYGHAALNHMRWVQGMEEFADMTQYRQYLVNHEVGHLLGRRHEQCPGDGAVAPVMQQQTIRVAPCVANAWPYPDAS